MILSREFVAATVKRMIIAAAMNRLVDRVCQMAVK